ncbi:hypothetical protein JX266_009466 [Neoarthrinium moseri]|nr:hypothetical protein JX266_009466 [Neoarthrinium moseri]
MKLGIVTFAVGAFALQLLPPPIAAPASGQPDLSASFRYKDVAKSIYITRDLASHRDLGGLTLIPPSGQEFAQIFRDELADLTKEDWSLEVVDSLAEDASGILLSLYNGSESDFTYATGAPTEEGYQLIIKGDKATISGAGARGVFWGTRTLLQYLIVSNWTEVPGISVKEAPNYPTRGYLLDAGRKWYSPAFLKDLCTYASFFKMSEFHYHTSDNYPLNRGHNETWTDVYTQFSLHPEDEELAAGLVQRPNQTLSRADFEDLQQHCAQRGITVIPEIEAPGHCLAITKWKPELALAKKDLLNLTHPDSVPTVKRIWAEFLPWFQTKEVHIGADEYDATLADDYNHFVNEMAAFVNATSGKRVRIWGTEEPSNRTTIARDVVVQHWQLGQSDPAQLRRDGHALINSADYWAYMSLKNDHMPISPAPYPQFFNTTRIVVPRDGEANSASWQWDPSFFNTSAANTTQQLVPVAGGEGDRGAILAAWNDNGPDATTQLEAYYAMRKGIPLIAAKAWNGGRIEQPGDVEALLEYWATHAPSQDLERHQTSFVSWTRGDEDENTPVTLGGGSRGLNYTLTLSVTGPFTLSSDDAALSLLPNESLVFSADGYEYPLRAVAEADGFDPGHPGRIWVNATTSSHEPVAVAAPAEVTITGDAVGGARVWVDGRFAGRFEVFVFGGRNTQFSWSQMAFVAPLQTVTGGVQKIVLAGSGGGGGNGAQPGGGNGTSTAAAPSPTTSLQYAGAMSRRGAYRMWSVAGAACLVSCLVIL